MTTLFIIIAFIIVLVTGFIRIIYFFNKTKDKISFFEKFKAYYSTIANQYNKNKTFDEKLYKWIIKNLHKAQRELGIYGIRDYQPPFSNLIHKNYPYILNIIPEFGTKSIHPHDIVGADDILVMFLGVLEENQDVFYRGLKNPFKWFQQGISLFLSLPIYLLNWFGIINNNTKNKISTNILFKIISGLTGLVAFLSGLITVIVGADEFVAIIAKLFGN